MVSDRVERCVFAVLVDNVPGVLARVIGLFSARGYNIESLSVSEISQEERVSRITIVTRGTIQVLAQIEAQLKRLVPVLRVCDLTAAVEREVALLKVVGRGEQRLEALRIAAAFSVDTIDAGLDYFIFQIQDRPDKVARFVLLMKSLGLVEIVRSGAIAITRGAETIENLEDAAVKRQA